MYLKTDTQGISPTHERRTDFLRSLAFLAGFNSRPWVTLPDGRIPDVLLFRPADRGLFIGDAKDTETPGTRQTQARLLSYMHWYRAHLLHPLAQGIFAVCFGDCHQKNEWLRLIRFLSHEVCLTGLEFSEDRFASGLHVACCYRSMRAETFTQKLSTTLSPIQHPLSSGDAAGGVVSFGGF